jgi:hypothetical protein
MRSSEFLISKPQNGAAVIQTLFDHEDHGDPVDQSSIPLIQFHLRSILHHSVSTKKAGLITSPANT